MKKTVAALLALALSFLSLSGCASESKPVLTVYNWGDYIAEGVISDFEEQFGVKVNYETFEQNEDMYTKLKTAKGAYDVIIPSDYMIDKMAREGLLEKLDLSNIPNYGLIDDAYKNLEFDPNNEYSVPYMWGTVGILYNTDMVSDTVDSWDILWDVKYSQQLFMMDSVRDSMAVALLSLGYDVNTADIDEIESAKQKLIAQKPLVLAYTGDEIKDKMVAGEGALSVMYSGDAITVREMNDKLEYVIPREGSNVWVDSMCVVKDSKNKELAEKFINYMCSTDVAAANRDYIYYSTPQTEVYDALPDEIKNDAAQYPGAEVIARCKTYRDLGDMNSVYDEFWVSIKSH